MPSQRQHATEDTAGFAMSRFTGRPPLILSAVVLVVGICIWLPQLPLMGPGIPGVDYTALVEGITHQTSQHGGPQDTAGIASPETSHPPLVATQAMSGEGPVKGVLFRSLSLLVISGVSLAAILAARSTSLGSRLTQLIGLRLPSANLHLGRVEIPVRLGVFLI